MDFVTAERKHLIETFERVGATAPTLCEGWDAEDLLRHLVMREIYPHRSLLSKVPLKSADESRHLVDEIEDADYDSLLETFTEGRQRYSPLQLGLVDRAMNTLEYVIHHEDLRRAQDPPIGRVLSNSDQQRIFTHLSTMAQVLFLKAPVRVVLRAPGVGEFTALATKRHGRTVTITGAPLELAMYAFGRDHAHVELSGEDEALRKFEGLDRSA